MEVKTDWKVRPAVFADQRQIANLIHFEPHLHRHLDWRNPLDWIGSPPFFVAESDGQAIAALGCPPDPPQVAWIRLFVCASGTPVQEVWEALWAAARADLTRGGSFMAAAILLHEWMKDMLETSGFHAQQQIVMLQRDSQEVPEIFLPVGLTIRPLMHYDLPEVAEVDAAAFDLLWQNSFDSLSRAYPQSAWATVVESERGIEGYQVSTRNPLGGHLARLAVRPDAQSKGVGRALVADLIRQMAVQGLMHLTVNTQNDNLNSLSLYRKIGFRETGDRYPVYVFKNSEAL
jgi:[ribosomal protein S18]-alanine N-acetyltransferase